MKKKANQKKETKKEVQVVAPQIENAESVIRPNWNDLYDLMAEDND